MVKAYNHIFMGMWDEAVKAVLEAFRLNQCFHHRRDGLAGAGAAPEMRKSGGGSGRSSAGKAAALELKRA